MGYQPVDIGLLQAIFRQGFVNYPSQGVDGDLENLVTLHLEITATRLVLRVVGGQIGHIEQILILPIRMDMRTEQPRLLRRSENHSASAIAEEHAGGSIRPVNQAGIHLAADHQNMSCTARAYVLVRNAEGEDKPRTGRLHIKSGAISDFQPMLQQTRRTGKHAIGRTRAHDDEIQGIRLQSSGLECLPCGRFSHTGSRLMLGRYPALPYARPFDDPLIIGVDRPGNFLVRENLFWQIATGTEQAGVYRHAIFLEAKTSATRSLIRSGTPFSTSSMATRMALAKARWSALP